MRRLCNGFVMVTIGLAAAGVAFAQKPTDEHVPGRLLVQAVNPADPAAARAIALAGARVHHTIDQINVQVLEVPEQALDAVSRALQHSGRFTFVERDYVAHPTATPNDPDFSSQWHLAKIQAPNAWNINIGSASVPIAIVDSGADPTHPDLAPKLISGWNFLTGNSNTSDTGCNSGHGTAISGAAAAATNNLIGVAGVAWANTIMPLVVVNSSCVAQYSDMASAFTYAADHGVRIISISGNGSTASSTLQSAVDYAWNKGAVIFAAAGNNSSSAPAYPAACNNVLAISGTEPDDTFSSFSNYGSWIDLAAPADSILTTQLGGSYGQWWGTSFSSPIAAAVAALALSANPSLTNSQLVSLLENNSDDLGAPGYDQYFGWGRVNAYKTVAAAAGAGTVNNTAPSVSISSPTSGATLSGTISVQGSASAGAGLSQINFYANGVLTATATVSPFSFSWNTTSQSSGTDTLSVTAVDTLGNSSTASVSVNVSNTASAPAQDTTPPVVAITSPANGSRVSKTITIQVSATDNVSVARVSIYVDNVQLCNDTSTPYSCSWNPRKASTGTHTITATAWDTSGNAGYATPVMVTK